MYICYFCNIKVLQNYSVCKNNYCLNCFYIAHFSEWHEVRKKGILHNLKGPARVNYKTGEKEFYYNGTLIAVKTLKEFKKALKIISFL